MKFTSRILWIVFCLLLSLALLGRSSIEPGGTNERFRYFTRMVEFDYVNWTIDALVVKAGQASLGITRYLPDRTQHEMVMDYLALTNKVDQLKSNINNIYSNPEIKNPLKASSEMTIQLEELESQRAHVGALVETILQGQVSAVLTSSGLSLGGLPIPPLLYHVSSLPYALIISPRETIRQDANISLLPGLSTQQIVLLEQQIENTWNVSALVTPVGGIGTYPTMVMSTTNINYLTDVISHEWTHNFLTLRPLGLNYETNSQLRTMNETAASIAGKEIGDSAITLYFPEYIPQPIPDSPSMQDSSTGVPLPFDFRYEMHITRLKVDQLLRNGKIEEAESYMEERRKLFWDNGYQIRRLNQAYFAFHGAYADEPGGAAGEDPVGPAVRQLRSQSESLAMFLNRISWMTSFDQLSKAVGGE